MTYLRAGGITATSPFSPTAAAFDPTGRYVAAIVARFGEPQPWELLLWNPRTGHHRVVARFPKGRRLTWTDTNRIVAWGTTMGTVVTLDGPIPGPPFS